MFRSEEFEKLLQPGVIQGVELRNRAVAAPMGSEYALRDGTVSERMLRYYEDKARGGVGLIIVEYAHIDQDASMAVECQLGIYDNACIAGLSRLSEVMQQHGAKTCLQIVHCGATKYNGFRAVAPSRRPFLEVPEFRMKGGPVPEELSEEEIHEIIENFGRAAARAKRAGYDMIEIHGAHGYLITEFLSPLTNWREDAYGGDPTRRMRFVLEVVRRVKEEVGSGYPVGIRLSGSEYQDGGITIEDTIGLCKELENEGVAYVHISGGNLITIHTQVVPSCLPRAFNVWAAEAVKKEIGVPVIASGSLVSPEIAEEVLKEGKADYVSFGRPLLADPYFIRKLEGGRRKDIRPCIRCLQGCLTKGTIEKRGLMCSVNVALGREERFGDLQYRENEPARERKKVFVIGGGPGGMEAARIAALRGHSVTLYEKRDVLGGALIEASAPSFKEDLRPLIAYLSAQIDKPGIQVYTKKELTTNEIVKESPDTVILAVGGKSYAPDVPGIDKPHVVSGLDVLRGMQTGSEVVVVGGNLTGAEIAWFLLEQGKKVTVTTMEEEIGMDMEYTHKKVLTEEMNKKGVKTLTGVSLMAITDKGATLRDKAGRDISISAESVVIATGARASRELMDQLRSRGLQVIPVGDCIKPRGIHEAIYEGHVAGRMV